MDAGTEKPAAKGKRMYIAEKLTMVEMAPGHNGTTAFRANCEASLRKSCRYPALMIDKDGLIVKAACNCEAKAGK